MRKILGWEISVGFYPGILVGFRSYIDDSDKVNHVLYVPFLDICLTFHMESNG
jgi:hypothetical protein